MAQDNIPSFLEHLAERILQTGKYLNVVRECGLEVACPGAKGERCVGGCVCGGGWRWHVLELRVRGVWVGVCVGGAGGGMSWS